MPAQSLACVSVCVCVCSQGVQCPLCLRARASLMRAVIVAQFLWPLVAVPAAFCLCQPVSATVTAVRFEPTPLRTGAWSQRLRPLGQTVCTIAAGKVAFRFEFHGVPFSEAFYVYGSMLSRGSKARKMTAVGFEPTQLALVELEPTPLDHSGKLSLTRRRIRSLSG